jgi:hypothetical protein
MRPADKLCAATDDDARSDRFFFGDNPERRFRARPGEGGRWFVRARGLLRTFSGSLVPSRDTDVVVGPLWFRSAWPDLAPGEAVKLARRAGVRGLGQRK